MPKSEKKKLFTATYYADGVRKYVRSAISQRDADKRALKLEADYEAGRVTIGGDMRFKQYAELWLENYKRGTVSEPEYKSHRSRLNNHILPSIGNVRMKDIRPLHLQKILNAQAGKSKSHGDKINVTIQEIFSRAKKDKIIYENPAEDITQPAAEDGSHRSITPFERMHILKVAEHHRYGLALMFTLLCGLRPQEVVALKWGDIDQVKRRVCVRRALKKDGSIGTTKSKSGVRDVPIPPMLWGKLSIGDLDDYIITNVRGDRMSHTAIRRAWEGFKHDLDISMGATYETQKYGVRAITKSVVADDLTPYCLRHTYCTDLESAGVPINVAKYLMGHSSIAITAKIYTHMREDTLDGAAEKIAEFGQTGATVGATVKGKNGGKQSKQSEKTEKTNAG